MFTVTQATSKLLFKWTAFLEGRLYLVYVYVFPYTDFYFASAYLKKKKRDLKPNSANIPFVENQMVNDKLRRDIGHMYITNKV